MSSGMSYEKSSRYVIITDVAGHNRFFSSDKGAFSRSNIFLPDDL